MSRIWHTSDPHLSCNRNGPPIKTMTRFSPRWENWDKNLAEFWDNNVDKDDIVLLGGDILWPNSAHDASWSYLADRPGQILFIDGNHDKFIRQGIDRHGGAKGYSDFMFHKYGVRYLGGTGFIKIGNTGILAQKLFDLPTHTFYSHYQGNEGTFINEHAHLENLMDEYSEEMLGCKNRIFMSHYPPMDNHLNYEGSAWIKVVNRIKPTHWLYGHYHGEAVWNFLPSCDTEWNNIKFMNSSLDLYNFKLRCVLETVD